MLKIKGKVITAICYASVIEEEEILLIFNIENICPNIYKIVPMMYNDNH